MLKKDKSIYIEKKKHWRKQLKVSEVFLANIIAVYDIEKNSFYILKNRYGYSECYISPHEFHALTYQRIRVVKFDTRDTIY